MIDNSFKPEYSELLEGLEPYKEEFKFSTPETIPEDFPENGFGEKKTIECLAPIAIGKATKLDDPLAFAHMDPPTPWITWIMSFGMPR